MSERTYVIAEMACSHDGSGDLAREIIDGAGKAGADAVQLQIWKREEIMPPFHPEFETLSRIELSRDTWTGLADYTRKFFPGMQLIACVYGTESADFCESIGIDAYKLHTTDLSNPVLVKHVASTGKRIDLSVGGSTLDEIRQAVDWIRETSASKIWMMYGYQNFPTPTDAIHLRFMKYLRQEFGLPIGYQDHSAGGSGAGFWLPAAALGQGVEILEKHITHDRAKKGIDHQSALNPDEFAEFVSMVREIEAALGIETPRPFSPDEEIYRKRNKKSVVAARDLPAGIILGEKDLLFMRVVEQGLPPDRSTDLIGRRVVRNLSAYEIIREEDLS